MVWKSFRVQQAEHDLEVAKASATSSVAGAKVEVANARRHLLILGMTDSAIDALASKSNLASVFSLTAPISGIVVERNATIGATVGTDANLFKIIDLSSVWIDANVFEKDLERVRQGQEVKVTVPAYPGETFTGRVILISSIVNPDTRERSAPHRREVQRRGARHRQLRTRLAGGGRLAGQIAARIFHHVGRAVRERTTGRAKASHRHTNLSTACVRADLCLLQFDSQHADDHLQHPNRARRQHDVPSHFGIPFERSGNSRIHRGLWYRGAERDGDGLLHQQASQRRHGAT